MSLCHRWLAAILGIMTAFSLTAVSPVMLNADSAIPDSGEQMTGTVQLQVVGDDTHGIIFPKSAVTLEPDDTAFSVMLRAVGPAKVSYTGSGSTLYVQEIDGLGEFDRGPLSGWLFRVNGEFPPHSAGVHSLQDGDVVEWLYTTDGGNDISFQPLPTVKNGNNRFREAPSNTPSTPDPSPERDSHPTPPISKPSPPTPTESFSSPPRESASSKKGQEIKESTDHILSSSTGKLVQWIQSKGVYSDWEALGLYQSTGKVPAVYLSNTAGLILDKGGDFRKVTDYERMALGIQAAGGDPRNFAGYDLIEKIYNSPRMTNQGSNGIIFALIALDSNRYTIPKDALWTRDKLLEWLLNNQNSDGSWALSPGHTGDVDITAMAITALAPYSGSNVKSARDKGVMWLSQQQTETGGFRSWGVENSESASQVIIALTSTGMSPMSSAFTKKNGNVLENLLTFQVRDGGFSHLRQGAADQIASEQALLALTAYQRFQNGKPGIYDLTGTPLNDIPITHPGAKRPHFPTDEQKTHNGKISIPSVFPGTPVSKVEDFFRHPIHKSLTDSDQHFSRSSFQKQQTPVSPPMRKLNNFSRVAKKDLTGNPGQPFNPTWATADQVTELTPGKSPAASKGERGYILILAGILCLVIGISFYLYERRKQWN